jgi:6-phosphogluconolactonase (cycloisomerase 2 family)
VYAEKADFARLTNRTIDAYALDALSGSWTPAASIPAPGYGSLALAADGGFLFHGEWGSRRPNRGRVATVTSYRIDPASGRLSATSSVDFSDMDETLVFVHPTRPFLYVADQSFDGVSVFRVAGGGPARVSTADTAAPLAVATDPLGRFAYLTSSFARNDWPESTILGFALSPLDGSLQLLGPVTAGARLAVAPSGRFAYAARPHSDVIAAHSLDGTSGRLVYRSTVAAKGVNHLAVDPGGRYLFACGDGVNFGGTRFEPLRGVLALRLDPATGAATVLGRAGDEPCDCLAVDPLGRFLYVSRAGGADVFAYRIEDGSLTEVGSVRNERAGWIGFAVFDP